MRNIWIATIILVTGCSARLEGGPVMDNGTTVNVTFLCPGRTIKGYYKNENGYVAAYTTDHKRLVENGKCAVIYE